MALGPCSKEAKEVAIRHVSCLLLNARLSRIDSALLAVLPPPVHDKLFLANKKEAEQITLESHQEGEEETYKKFPNILVAMEAADSLNESLAASPPFAWRRSEANQQNVTTRYLFTLIVKSSDSWKHLSFVQLETRLAPPQVLQKLISSSKP
jgi:hypothetical protein